LALVPALGVWLLAAACGYALVGAGLPTVDTVAVRTPANDSSQPGVEFVVADALRQELLRRNEGALSEDPERAGLVVSGRVVGIRTGPRAFSSAILARENEVALELALEAVRRDGTKLELPKGVLRETERYLGSADVEAERKNRQEALRRLADLLAARFFDSVSEALIP
jgi:outer membrane lipopolysaccharide assembly protein LptE/RlpB